MVVVDEAVDRLIPATRLGSAGVIGACWTTDDAVEIDLVGADRRDPPAKQIAFLGSIRWGGTKPLTMSDDNAPGAEADALAAFSVVLDPSDILAAWSVR